MPWVKLDERFRHHPKAIRVGPLGRDLYVCGLSYCNENLTDGFIEDDMVTHLAPGQPRPAKIVARLLDAGLWIREDGGYRVHDFLKYQPSAAHTLAEREAARTRKERWKEQRRNGVPNGNGTGVEQAPRPDPTRPVPDPKDLEAREALSGERPTPPANREIREHARLVLAFLNEKTQRAYRPTDANLKLIEARLKSGATVQDCKSVIARKCRAWLTDPRMAEYLRPATLFGATKFEQYVGEIPREEP